MRLFQFLKIYFRGIQVPAIILSLMMTCSVFLGVLTFSRIKFIVSEYDVVRNANVDNAYYVEYFFSTKDYQQGNIHLQAREIIQEISLNSNIDQVYPIRIVNPLSYNDYGISIILYDPQMLAAFPDLKKLGIDFSDNESGCILGSKVFSKMHGAKEISLEFYAPNYHTETFEIISHIKSPYKYLSLSTSNTKASAKDLFSTGDIIIMLATEEMVQKFESIADVRYHNNFIVSLKDIEDSKKQHVIAEIENSGAIVYPFEDIVERTREEIIRECKTILPRPLFLLLAATTAFFSNVILFVKKKEKEFAVFYLCGGSKKDCAALTILGNCLIALVPVILNCAFVLLAPTYDWLGYIDLDGFLVTEEAYGLVLGYLVIMLTAATLTTIAMMHKKTPAMLLRGVL